MTMKRQLLPTCTLLAILWLFVTTTLCAAADVSFSWLPNNDQSDLAGYKIYYGTSRGHYTNHVNVGHPPTESDGRVHYTITGLTGGTTYYFVATAYNTEGNESDYSTEVVWTAPTHDGANTTPTAAISVSTRSGTAALKVLFDGSASTDPDNDQLMYHWDFGDGTSASGATSQHIYAAPGTYHVTLTVTDDSNAQNQATATIIVTAADNSGTTISPPPTMGTGTGDKQSIMATLQQVYMLLL